MEPRGWRDNHLSTWGSGIGFNRKHAGIVVVAFAILSVIAGCSEVQVPTPTPVESVVTVVPDDTPVPTIKPPPPPCDEDCLLGKELFDNSGCATCHSTGDDKIVGPGLAGVYARADRRKVLERGRLHHGISPKAPSIPGRWLPASDAFVRPLQF